MGSGGTKIGLTQTPVMIWVLTLVTCGIYGIYYMYKNFEDLKQRNGEGLGGAVGALLSLVVAGYFMLPIEIEKMYQKRGRQSPVNAVTGVFILIPIVGFLLYIQKIEQALTEVS